MNFEISKVKGLNMIKVIPGPLFHIYTCISHTKNYNFSYLQILDTLITFHKGIQDLKLFHFGGDEVAPGAWDNSPMCKQLFKQTSIVK